MNIDNMMNTDKKETRNIKLKYKNIIFNYF